MSGNRYPTVEVIPGGVRVANVMTDAEREINADTVIFHPRESPRTSCFISLA